MGFDDPAIDPRLAPKSSPLTIANFMVAHPFGRLGDPTG